jgi:hypothetical protein
MTKQLAVFGGMLALLTIGSGPAVAFEETTVAPQVAPAAQQLQGEGLDLDLSVPNDVDAGEGLKLQGSGTLKVMPKMDFGLELLYSSKDEDDALAFAGPDAEDSDDIKVLGTVRRRF